MRTIDLKRRVKWFECDIKKLIEVATMQVSRMRGGKMSKSELKLVEIHDGMRMKPK